MRYEFSDCVLDGDSHRFSRSGQLVDLEPQVFDLLLLLAENAGRLVTKDQMVERVWGGRIVSEAAISSRISAARSAVGDSGKEQHTIKTIARRGIELIAPVKSIGDAPAGTVASVADTDIEQKIRFATSRDGTSIAYATSGSGPPVMRAGHFLTHLEKEWSGIIWRPYLQRLSQRHRVIRYDMRMTGLSDRAPADLSLQAYAEDMLAVADAAGLDRFPVIAASQSVPIAIYVAANHPDRVSRMVLYGGFAQGRSKRPDSTAKEEANMLLGMMKAGWGQRGSAFLRSFTTLYCPEATPEEIDDLIEMQLASATPEAAVAIRLAMDNYDALDCLARIKAPTLVMHARGDALQPVAQARIIASGIAGAEYVELDSNNHIYLQSDPVWEGFVERILKFIAQD